MFKKLVVVVLASLLWGMASVQAAGNPMRIWETSSAEGFPAFYKAMETSGWVKNGQIVRGGIGAGALGALSADQISRIPEKYRTPEEFGRMMFKQHGLVDSRGNIRESISPDEFKAIGQGRTSSGGWWLLGSEVFATQQVATKLNTTAEFVDYVKNKGGNFTADIRPAENQLAILELQAGDNQTVAEAIAVLRQEINALKNGTFTPEMDRELSVRFAEQMGVMRKMVNEQLNALAKKVDRQFTEVDRRFSEQADALNGIRVQADADAQANALLFTKQSSEIASLNEGQSALKDGLSRLEQNLSVQAKGNGWKINTLFVLVSLCIVGIISLFYSLWSQRPGRDKHNLSFDDRPAVNDASISRIKEENIFNVREAAIAMAGRSR